MGKKLKKLDPWWRWIVALALVLAMVPALAVSMATPAGASSSTFAAPQLETSGDATAEWSTGPVKSGCYSAHLKTNGTVGDGDEARVVIPLPAGTTLGEITSISWWEYLVAPAGYPPHVDISLDFDGDGVRDDTLVFEYAYNYESHFGEVFPTYGAVTGGFYQTFSDDGNGPTVINDDANAWLGSGSSGSPDYIYGTLGEWKAGTVDGSVTAATEVLYIEIEVDNWITQTEAYVDDVTIDGTVYGMAPDPVLAPYLCGSGVSELKTLTVGGTSPGQAINKVELWIPAGYTLTDVPGEVGWGVSLILNKIIWSTVTSAIAPGECQDFTFTVTTPATTGPYGWNWKLTDDVSNTSTGTCYQDVDPDAPVITETPVEGCVENTWVEVCATITDASANLDTTTLYYSTDEGTTWTDLPMATNGVPDKYCATITGLKNCDVVWYYKEAKDTVGNTTTDPGGAPENYYEFMVDLSDPVVTVDEPNGGEDLTGCEDEFLIEWTATDTCCDNADILIDIELWVGGVYYSTIATGEENDGEYLWHVDPSVDSDLVKIKVIATDCCGRTNEDASDANFTITSAPMLFGAITGWAWDWNADGPWNANSRTTIMVVFNKELDLSTVDISDFEITNPVMNITDIEIHTFAFGGDWTLVFLTTAEIMATGATPTVKVLGEILDTGDPQLAIEYPVDVLCQDGIAPIITLSADPAEPGYNEMVTVTATASEPMSEAYIQVFTDGLPEKPAGYEQGTEPKDWTDLGWEVMDGSETTWTYSFRYAYRPGDMVTVEVAGHDFTEWEQWSWKHEKWTEESIKFHAIEYFEIVLYEDWNLISVPWDLTDPSVGAVLPGSTVNKVLYYTGGYDGTWQFAFLNPVTGEWFGPITEIEPGKAYWVYSSPPKFTLRLYTAPVNPLAPPPSYSLEAGWNMIGYTYSTEETQSEDFPIRIHHYLNSLMGKASVLYALVPMEGWFRWHSGSHYEFGHDYMEPGWGYWLFLTEAGVLAP